MGSLFGMARVIHSRMFNVKRQDQTDFLSFPQTLTAPARSRSINLRD